MQLSSAWLRDIEHGERRIVEIAPTPSRAAQRDDGTDIIEIADRGLMMEAPATFALRPLVEVAVTHGNIVQLAVARQARQRHMIGFACRPITVERQDDVRHLAPLAPRLGVPVDDEIDEAMSAALINIGVP